MATRIVVVVTSAVRNIGVPETLQFTSICALLARAIAMLLPIKNLLDEKLVEVVKEDVAWVSGSLGCSYISLTETGSRFIEEWIEAKEELTY